MTEIRGISSMATRQVLAELAQDHAQRGGATAAIESVGGVDAARRVQADEPFDLVVLASDAIDKLEAAGKLQPHSRVDIVRSGVAVAVRAGTPQPRLASENDVKQAVLDAASIGYSTGPSGNALLKLFERWGIADRVKDKLVQATPGVPVGSLVAEGRAALGFQQLSELIHLGGIEIVPLPQDVQIVTVFTGAVCRTAMHPQAARELLAFMASREAADAKRRQGMAPA